MTDRTMPSPVLPRALVTPGVAGVGWLLYAAAWIGASIVWALAAGIGFSRSPLAVWPEGLLIMAAAGVWGLGAWHLTGRLEWSPRHAVFWMAHTAAMLVYASLYSSATIGIELLRGSQPMAAMWAVLRPLLGWNLFLGSWLYMVVVGLSYAVRADRRIRDEQAAAAEARALARDAQLEALRAQLNPHFLFNALHTVGALVRADPDAADRALDELGGLLRYTLREDQDLVSLDDEWAFTSRYLEFERLRLGDRLRLDVDLDPSAGDIMVPAFSLQPLVENAIHHGIAPNPDGGELLVRVARSGDLLTLRVENSDGPSSEMRAASPGLGLRSLERRLALCYGARASIDIRRSAANRFLVTLRIPIEGGRA